MHPALAVPALDSYVILRSAPQSSAWSVSLAGELMTMEKAVTKAEGLRPASGQSRKVLAN